MNITERREFLKIGALGLAGGALHPMLVVGWLATSVVALAMVAFLSM